MKIDFWWKATVGLVKSTFDICLNQWRLVGWIWAVGGCLREGWGKCLKYFKMGWNRKEGRENKDFKKGGQAGSKGGCLKKGGEEWAGTSLQFIMNIYIYILFWCELCWWALKEENGCCPQIDLILQMVK